AARRSAPRCGAGRADCAARPGMAPGDGRASQARRHGWRGRRARAVRLAAGGTARLALRPGTEDAGSRLGQAPLPLVAKYAQMNRVAASLAYAFLNLLHPRMLWLVLWPMLVSLFLWGGAAIALWTRTAFWFAGHIREWLASGIFLVRFEAGDWVLI